MRVNADLRMILYRSEGSLLLYYAGHHDDAYRWGEARKLERYPMTGAAQLVELRETVRETVREVVVPRFVEAEEPRATPPRRPFDGVKSADLLAYGAPEEWVSEVAGATEEQGG